MSKLASILSRILLFIALLGLSALLQSRAHPQFAQADPPKQNGISYAAWGSGQYSDPDSDLSLSQLSQTGAGWISLIVTQYQDNINSTSIYTTTATPSDADLAHAIAQAHSLGLKVMLKPHVDLENDPDHWRGEIGVSFNTAQWTAWFASYTGFIVHYAQLAQTNGADQFCVGTELSGTETQVTKWRSVIAAIRAAYSSPLTYASNYGDEGSLAWWDALDYIGVDAYYTLSDKDDPSVAEQKAAWQPIVANLASLSSTWHKTILFTEIGYRSQPGAAQHPWEWQNSNTVDLQEQTNAYQAAFESVYDQPWFAGVFWWDWETDPFQGGPCDDNYTVHDKPAEDVVRQWYGAAPRSIQPAHYPLDYPLLNVYGDSLAAGWEDWSWGATLDFANSTAYKGAHAIQVTAQPWGALSLYHPSFDSTPYTYLEFYLRKGSSAQSVGAMLHDDLDHELRQRPVEDCRYTNGSPIQAGVWTRVDIPLSHLNGAGSNLTRIDILDNSDYSATFYVDEMRLVGAGQPLYLPLIFFQRNVISRR